MAEAIPRSDKAHVKPRVERKRKKHSGVKALEIPAKYSRQNPDIYFKYYMKQISAFIFPAQYHFL